MKLGQVAAKLPPSCQKLVDGKPGVEILGFGFWILELIGFWILELMRLRGWWVMEGLVAGRGGRAFPIEGRGGARGKTDAKALRREGAPRARVEMLHGFSSGEERTQDKARSAGSTLRPLIDVNGQFGTRLCGRSPR